MHSQTNPGTNSTAPRLYFLDWIRILAFMLLVLYHTGMYYVTWDWHVKSVDASHAIEPLMLLSSPWRLGLLFLIAGVASACMLQKTSVAAFVRGRSVRLLPPLLFGMLVIVPPQSYFEVVEKLSWQGGYGAFMRLYVAGYHGFCRPEGCLSLPTWNHLWFVAYLWVYALLLGGAVWLAGAHWRRWSDAAGRLLTGWKIIVLPVALLAGARLLLADSYPQTHALFGDWHSHAQYGALFVLGALLAPQTAFWQRVDALRWTSLGLSLACWALVVIYFLMPDALSAQPEVKAWRPLMRIVYSVCQWTPVLAACGFGHRHLNADSAARRYLTEAVFPVYILHQTLIVCMAHWLKPVHMAPQLEGALLVTLTLCISFGGFELVRRSAVLRPLFGLAISRKSAYAPPHPAAAASACPPATAPGHPGNTATADDRSAQPAN